MRCRWEDPRSAGVQRIHWRVTPPHPGGGASRDVMHDPMTVAFSIRWPWFWKTYRPSIVTIWHVDPETDGSDDSCGWSFPRLTKRQRSIMEHLAYCEARDPWFQRDPVKRIGSAADAEALMRGALVMVARCLRIRISWEKLCRLASELTHNSGDNFQGSLCHLPGWHTNSDRDDVSDREHRATCFFCQLGRLLLREKRPWYRHPKWHVWHWKIQIHPLQHFKRWAFSRCEHCGGRFRWGESPCSGSWNGTGPLWFKSESYVHHSACSKPTPTPEAAAAD